MGINIGSDRVKVPIQNTQNIPMKFPARLVNFKQAVVKCARAVNQTVQPGHQCESWNWLFGDFNRVFDRCTRNHTAPDELKTVVYLSERLRRILVFLGWDQLVLFILRQNRYLRPSTDDRLLQKQNNKQQEERLFARFYSLTQRHGFPLRSEKTTTATGSRDTWPSFVTQSTRHDSHRTLLTRWLLR